MRRVLSAVVLVSAMFAAVVSSAPPVGSVAGFGDVDVGRFFTEPVQWMVDNNITTGTSPTCFSPEDAVTRGQAAAFMWRMEGRPDPGTPHSFTDVIAAYQQDPVSWMSNNNITTGTSPTTYSPDDPLTRGQIAALMWRLAGNPAAAGHPFTDVTKSWQQTPVAWMVANSITTGTSPTTFSPDDTVTRGQLATFFYRYKGSPAVTVDPTHPTSPTCAAQVAGPPSSTSTTTSTTTTTTTTMPPPTDVVTDTFTRSDGGLGNAETGQAWNVDAGTFGVSSNAAIPDATPFVYSLATLDAGTAERRTEVTVTGVTGNEYWLIVRGSSATDYWRFGRLAFGFYELEKQPANTNPAEPATNGAFAASEGDVLECLSTSSTLTCSVNGTEVWATADMFNNTATRVGLAAYQSTNTFDDLSSVAS
jgi:hypothetical protein